MEPFPARTEISGRPNDLRESHDRSSGGGFIKNVDEVRSLVVATYNNKPVYLRDVANIEDGPEEPSQYVWMGSGPAATKKNISVSGIDAAAITLAISKKPGTNAIELANELDARIQSLKATLIPSDITVTKTRDYGFTAQEKSNELIFHVGFGHVVCRLLDALDAGTPRSSCRTGCGSGDVSAYACGQLFLRLHA